MRHLWFTCSALALLLVLAGCSSRPDAPSGHGGGFAGMRGGRVAVSPAGEPLGLPAHDEAAYVAAVTQWFQAADLDKDGVLSRAEMQADTARFFQAMDKDGDHAVNTRELAEYRQARLAALRPPRPDEGEGKSLPRRQGPPADLPAPAGGGGGVGGGDVVMAADTNLDFRVTLEELTHKALERLATMDSDHDGRVTLAELQDWAAQAYGEKPSRGRGGGGGGGGGHRRPSGGM
ncbi:MULTISPECIES: hypothetical protein [unclassified Azospirillum]|uniref:hypothetical protein n=1 Tax=unclassified Azospirillum TaxID=2630922 RepID=UPI000B732451|nr:MULTISPECIES: hypothetical protein [unclassified Azospirillum]SNR95086.1 EF hand [Azospirillum sp. RU38E]SNS11352.1 EF hand [Azospirillum sp. RU37A]